jgi:hypothetical protein
MVNGLCAGNRDTTQPSCHANCGPQFRFNSHDPLGKLLSGHELSIDLYPCSVQSRVLYRVCGPIARGSRNGHQGRRMDQDSRHEIAKIGLFYQGINAVESTGLLYPTLPHGRR